MAESILLQSGANRWVLHVQAPPEKSVRQASLDRQVLLTKIGVTVAGASGAACFTLTTDRHAFLCNSGASSLMGRTSHVFSYHEYAWQRIELETLALCAGATGETG